MYTNSTACAFALQNEKKIKVEGYYGWWSVIDSFQGYVLLEHNTYGDETNLLVTKASNFFWKQFTLKEGGTVNRACFHNYDVYETYDDIETAIKDYGLTI